MYKLLVLGLVIAAIVMVTIKETRQEDSTDVVYLFKKTRNELSLQKKVSGDLITLNTDFERDLGMDNLEQDTLGLKLKEDLDIDLNLDDFHNLKTVGEAVDYLRLKVIERRDARDSKTAKKLTGEEVARKFLERQERQKSLPGKNLGPGKVAPPENIPAEVQGAR